MINDQLINFDQFLTVLLGRSFFNARATHLLRRLTSLSYPGSLMKSTEIRAVNVRSKMYAASITQPCCFPC